MIRAFYLVLLICPFFSISKGLDLDSTYKHEKKFETFHQKNYLELIYIHADKPYYLTGESIKFKIYCLERNSSKLSQLSKVAYVEIIDHNNEAHLQAKIKLDQGIGYGELFIPTNLISNNYVIRGYTRWMRNFGPQTFFHSLVTIINPFKRLGLPPIPKKEHINISFFSEGDQLIDGQNTRIVYSIKDENGHPVVANGKLFASDSILITEFKQNKIGIGSFEFTPDIKNKYHVQLVQLDGTVTIHQFLTVAHNGLTIHVKENISNYHVRIFCNDTSILNLSKSFQTVVYQKKHLVLSKQFMLNQFKYEFDIEKDLINDGIFTISLLKEDGGLIKERKLFKYLNTSYNSQKIANKSNFFKREKIILDLSKFELTKSANISLSISTIQDKFMDGYLDFNEYLLLDNSLNSIVHQLPTCLRSSNNIEAINNLLIAYANSDTTIWLEDKSKDYIAELRNPIITGSVRNKYTGEPGNSMMTYLSIPGKRLQFYSTRSNYDGKLLFELTDFYGSNEIVLQNDYTKDTIYTIDLDDPFSKEFIQLDIPALNVDESMKGWIERQSQNMQINNAYMKYKRKLPILTKIDTTAFYHEPDARYYLDDYTRFVVMEEVMREYVSGVNVRKNRNGFHFMVIDLDRNIVYEDNPLMLLDAVPVFDANEIMALDPLKVEKIETIKRRFHYGYLDCKGIVSYTTYDGDLNGYAINENALVFNYDGLQPKRQYEFPAYKTAFDENSKIPDFRNNLYWNPEILISDQQTSYVEVYSSDYSSRYEITIQGIDAEGHVFSTKEIINIE